MRTTDLIPDVIPTEAGIQSFQGLLDPRFHEGDTHNEFM
jgi:hypothetical protein